MTQAEAVEMIQGGVPKSDSQRWLDLGAGTGVFTEALGSLLAAGTVYAIDKQDGLSEKLIDQASKTKFISMQLDFVSDEIPVEPVDGVLMANVLHYVKDKKGLMIKLKKSLRPQGRFIIVEYDMLTSNQWVPYPIGFPSLRLLMTDCGFSTITKLHERTSIFNRAMMYSALVM